MKTKENIIISISGLLILLWSSVAIDKLWDWDSFQRTLIRQPFPDWWADILFWLLPTLELGIVILLAWPKGRFQHWGLLLSTILLMVFTSYIALGLFDFFEQRPCGCGSIISSMTWEQHLWFNLFFLFLSLTGTILIFTQRNNIIENEIVEG